MPDSHDSPTQKSSAIDKRAAMIGSIFKMRPSSVAQVCVPPSLAVAL